jgi:hypothetical protein
LIARFASRHALVVLLSVSPLPAMAAGQEVGTYHRSDALFWAVLALGVTHHVDHVLRDNHSGLPFTSQLTPFTPSLVVYPFYLGGYFLDAGPAYWVIVDSLTLTGVAVVHLTLEPVHDVYEPWVDGSNLTGVRSPAAGRIAQGVLVALMTAEVAHLASSVVDGVEYGFTWKKRETTRAGVVSPVPRVALLPHRNGLSLSASFRW